MDKGEAPAVVARPTEAPAAPVRTDRPKAAAPAPRPAAQNAQPPISATERRLKLIIETAPVGLMITDRSCQVLAANRAALALFGVEQLATIVGKPIGTLIAPEDRDSFATFVTAVCGGKSGTLEYDVVRADESRCRLETHAVAIRRGEDATAFLGASWDVTERNRTASALRELESKHALVESERDALKEALEEAKRTFATAGHEALADAERKHQEELAAAAEERARLEQKLRAHHEDDGQIGALRAEHDKLVQTLQELNKSYAELVTERTAERGTFDAALRGERARCTQLLAERDQWRAALAEILRAATETGEQAKRLLDKGTTLRLVSSANQLDQANGTQDAETEASPETATEPESETSWQF